MFRAKYLDGLAGLLEKNQLDLPPQLVQLGDPTRRTRWLRPLRKRAWVVYSQRPFAGPRKLLDYLGRYTHRVAISNHRILGCEDGLVRFHYRDRRDGDRRKELSLPADEFIGRLLKHVLPDGFMRIRHYGLLANRGKTERLAQVRQLLGARRFVKQEDEQPHTVADWMRLLLGIEIDRCPCCGEVLQRESLPPSSSRFVTLPHLPISIDTPPRGPPSCDTASSRAPP